MAGRGKLISFSFIFFGGKLPPFVLTSWQNFAHFLDLYTLITSTHSSLLLLRVRKSLKRIAEKINWLDVDVDDEVQKKSGKELQLA